MKQRIALLLLAATATHAAADYDATFEQAIETIDFDFQESWAYTETRVTDEHVWVGRHDPRRPPDDRWRLLTIDDRQPTAKEIEKYLKGRAHDHENRGEDQVHAMVAPDSIRLVKEDEYAWLFAFEPGDEEDAFLESLDATFRVNKAGGHLEYIEIRNHSPIKPAFSVRISKFVTRLTFGLAAEDGPIVPLSSHVEVRGRAFVVVSFGEQELVHRSDFEKAGTDH